MRAEELLLPERGGGILEVRAHELHEEMPGGVRVASRLECDPVGLRLVAARDRVLGGGEPEAQNHENESGQRDILRLTHSAPPTGELGDEKGQGEDEEGVPGEALQDV